MHCPSIVSAVPFPAPAGLSALRDFLDCYSTTAARQELSELLHCALGSPEVQDWSPCRRSDALFLCEQLGRVVEALPDLLHALPGL